MLVTHNSPSHNMQLYYNAKSFIEHQYSIKAITILTKKPNGEWWRQNSHLIANTMVKELQYAYCQALQRGQVG